MTLDKTLQQKDDEITELKAELELLRCIIRLMPGHVYWKNTDGIYLGCNQNFADTLQLTSSMEIKSKTDHQLLPATIANKIDINDRQVLQTGEEVAFEEAAIDAAGQPATYFSRKVLLKDPNHHVLGVLGISIDITAHKAAEAREKAAILATTAAKARIRSEEQLWQLLIAQSSVLSNDLHVSLNALHAQASQLTKHWPLLVAGYLKAQAAHLSLNGSRYAHGELADYLAAHDNPGEHFMQAIQGFENLISNTLKTFHSAFAPIITPENLVRCNMGQCLQSTLALYPHGTEARRHIQVEMQHRFDFMGNELLIMRVLSTLINNALDQIKQNQRGTIFITTEQGRNTNILRIKDTADGIAPEQLARLFDPCFTTHKEDLRAGLAFCKLTLQNFDGDILCNSVHGEYAEFVLTFPKSAKPN